MTTHTHAHTHTRARTHTHTHTHNSDTHTRIHGHSSRLATRVCECVCVCVCVRVCAQLRNLCLGLAARGVNWEALGGRGSLNIAGSLCFKLFANLFHRYVPCYTASHNDHSKASDSHKHRDT